MGGGGRIAPGAAIENNAGRFQGGNWYEPTDGRRYDSMDGGGRIVPGAAIENNAGRFQGRNR